MQGPYYICTIFHQSLYQRYVKLGKHEKYHVFISELYHPVRPFDEKLYICETCQKYLCEHETLCQSVCNKMVLDPIPDQLRDLKKLGKVLISERILFKNIAIMHGKGELSKIKRRICNIRIKAANITNILPRPAVCNRLIVVKVKRDLTPIQDGLFRSCSRMGGAKRPPSLKSVRHILQ